MAVLSAHVSNTFDEEIRRIATDEGKTLSAVLGELILSGLAVRRGEVVNPERVVVPVGNGEDVVGIIRDQERARADLNMLKADVSTRMTQLEQSLRDVPSLDGGQVESMLLDLRKEIRERIDGLQHNLKAQSEAAGKPVFKGPDGHVSGEVVDDLLQCAGCREKVTEHMLGDKKAVRYCLGKVCADSPGELAAVLASTGEGELAEKIGEDGICELGRVCMREWRRSKGQDPDKFRWRSDTPFEE